MMASRLRALRVVHPFPSILNSALVLGLSLVAGASTTTAGLLTLGMLGIQFCIGTVNDLHDEALDARSKSWKPLPAGLISRRSATVVAIASGIVGVVAPLLVDPVVSVLALAMLACGLVYDLWLKPTAFAWACFSIAFVLLPIYAWYGSAHALPPLSTFLLPLAALAGPALQLTNGLIDLERDEEGGVRTLATRLGRRSSLLVIAALLVAIYGIAWLTLVQNSPTLSVVAVAGATVLALVGLALTGARRVDLRGAGWTAQTVAIAVLAVGWLGAVQSVG